MQIYHSTLLSKKTIANRTLELRYTRPEDFIFQAGQFIQVMFGTKDAHLLRSYSISSIPTDEYIELCVKLYDNGVGSQFFTQAKEGEIMTFRGPAGRFICDTPVSSDLLFIATGAGLAPILSMIRHQLEHMKTTTPIHLIFGVRHEENIFWKDRLDALEQAFSNFTYTLSVSRAKDTWTGKSGRVTSYLPKHIIGRHSFVCGSIDMVKTVRQTLVEDGAPPDTVHFEIF